MKFKFLEHTADVEFQAFGKTLEEAFANSGLAMFNSMYKEKIKPKMVKKIFASGKDNEALLYNFLEELLILLDSEGFFLSSVKKIKITGKTLEAEVVGDNAADYPISVDVKAITYNEMFVREKKSKWVCQVVLDV